MKYFVGRYYHALEQKGRLSVPANFREHLGKTAMLTQGLDGCLFLFPVSQWEKVVEEVAQLPFTQKKARDWIRLLANNANEVTLDRVGRIKVPDFLKKYAQLDKDVVVVGSLSRIEIWDRDTYHNYIEDVESRAEEIAESIEA